MSSAHRALSIDDVTSECKFGKNEFSTCDNFECSRIETAAIPDKLRCIKSTRRYVALLSWTISRGKSSYYCLTETNLIDVKNILSPGRQYQKKALYKLAQLKVSRRLPETTDRHSGIIVRRKLTSKAATTVKISRARYLKVFLMKTLRCSRTAKAA